ncbi:MAG: 50S ribosomal protein L7/L12 [Candidatus Giovannonibacteria bacterium GW2011_GWB1_45_9b]|uniref:Large ribosomal subunit protein bL12 n=5 Tax=Candidatus Giovannoniibacteriota TaxID=1752738 RepID=A0A1F5X1K8_9BACT|nr:MAG: 50S ribosomal protein L7/L12 [Candidatus Giovannonibacteria bacterium GW2011_GWB1_45_9b]OGF73527.1 MAG: 50S ribosomal protein L7/L12 [Candidatus Giovannonibacteria bacterium RIFCSPHIGHO2_02_43_16]OGF81786.1 MAG: 50S ribosomal protein L7/L12 [Candidatus Giovannonibacteria bacterium RIFCSPHIGHO2_12_44_12]OGF86048.1 MAG: 50S ribosomal protein L7/L12 [Candidatus Giovannonibacteria bacterium RIFCSPLOWO2_02_44_8]OGF95729.1 MAG: 50S ribosomal protein L7/L12 [Candidatus Giovannonibacteria bacte
MADLEKIVDEISKLTALELSDLVKKIEEKFGVSAAPTFAVGAPTQVGGGEIEEEKSTFNVELKSTGAQKIAVIKVIREVLGLGLAEAKGLADAAPKVVKEGLDKAAATELKAKLEAAGAAVELK